MDEIVVKKLNLKREVTFQYPGRVTRRLPHGLVIEARFGLPDKLIHGMLFTRGDRFVEVYFSDRWYNIDEIHDRGDDAIKGWYCNVALPAEIEDGVVSYVDLALDLLVFPDGRQMVLDEDEFAELELPEADRRRARRALEELQALALSPTRFVNLVSPGA